MPRTERGTRERRKPKRSRFTDASPDEKSDSDQPNVSSTESSDSELEQAVNEVKRLTDKQEKQRRKDADVNERDWGEASKRKNKPTKRRRRRRSSSSSESSSDSESSDDSRRKRKRKKDGRKRKRRRSYSSSSESSSSSSSSSSGSSGSASGSDSSKKSSHDSDVQITGADIDLDQDVVITGKSFSELKKETARLAAKLKTQERKRMYNRFYIRTAPEEMDLMSNETLEERDARSIFVQQIHHKVHARDLHEFFSAVGVVKEVKVMCDEYGKRSKGMAYIEFGDVESIPLALGLSGQRILGVPIMVKLTDSTRNRTSNTTMWTRNSRIEEAARLFVGNLHDNMDEKLIRAIFEPFGKITHIRVERDQVNGESKGFAHVTFKSFDPSRRAMEALNGYKVGGKPMKVQLSAIGLDKTKNDTEVYEVEEDPTGENMGPGANMGVRFRPRPQGVGAHAKAQGWDEWVAGSGVKKEEVKEEDKQFIDKRGMLVRKSLHAKFDVLDKEEVDRGGITGMSRTEKVKLMARLADGTDMALPAGAQEVLDNAKRIQAQEADRRRQEEELKNTPCFMLKYMFNADDEDIKEQPVDEWTFDIEQDCIEETLDQGGLVHIHVDSKSREGVVYMKSPTTYVANEIIQALHGRYFGGRVLEAARIPLANYNELFPDSIGKDKVLQPED